MALDCAHLVFFQIMMIKLFTEQKIVNIQKTRIVNGSGVDLNIIAIQSFQFKTLFFDDITVDNR